MKNFILTDLIKDMISGLNKRTCQTDYVTNRSHLQGLENSHPGEDFRINKNRCEICARRSRFFIVLANDKHSVSGKVPFRWFEKVLGRPRKSIPDQC